MNDFFPFLCILLTGLALALHFGFVKAFLRKNTLETRKLELELRSIKTRLIPLYLSHLERQKQILLQEQEYERAAEITFLINEELKKLDEDEHE
ncbi:hypothetical protein [Bacteroides fragilis]|mgnify:FL=1|uniref:hypothetical protein n=1 Tax=Bacteroides fragilis TaxID=817 RepID=UPI00216462CC|nr:hypothetical protein [Bacteroides fragilis]MCS2887062.1 hypothetical protein [Bacteroides fragilis]UVR33143.1 hypothetical protein NXY10_18910 [Bacteroides fragilis]UVS03556.1 hypothetical protein NXX67_18825 [Bacteroides fragilis]